MAGVLRRACASLASASQPSSHLSYAVRAFGIIPRNDRPAVSASAGGASATGKAVPSDVGFNDSPDGVPFLGNLPDFPCISKEIERSADGGPEPVYAKINEGYKVYEHKQPFAFELGGILPQLQIAYETWGTLNERKDNAVLLHTGLSASSHAKSHADNTNPGWWEKFIGPGMAIDTNKFFVICTNVLGSCYGTSGPSSINPLTGSHYAMTFPLLKVQDMIRAQFHLIDSLGIDRLHASVGSSLGGMQSLCAAALFPQRVGRVVSISAAAKTHPMSIAMRYVQRRVLMSDPHWSGGNYYNKTFPHLGLKLSREIATITYRSGPEWEQRFARKRVADAPSFCPDFLIETYLDHQGEQFCLRYDPNSLLYISKAMDLFDVGDGFGEMEDGLARITCPVLVIGVQSDVLFPVWQQREIAQVLRAKGNNSVTYYELDALYGHDTFLLDLNTVGSAVKGHLENILE